jgi:hypothetical protein
METNRSELKIGDIVRANVRVNIENFHMLPGTEGCIVSINQANETAKVEYLLPKRPVSCEGCGAPSFSLSRDMTTGRVVCLRTGCGHDHGYDEPYVGTVSLAQLVAVSQ